MTTMKVRSLRHISTLRGLSDSLVPRKRGVALAELTHLEHEKAGLERKHQLLTHALENTQQALGQVEHRIALLEPLLGLGSSAAPVTNIRRDAPQEREEPARREVSLEY
jgi:hypothetical protein